MSQLDMFNSKSKIENYYGPRSPQLVYESKPTPKISITEDRLRLRLIGCQQVFTSWQLPLGAWLTIIVTLNSVEDFNNFIVDASVWEAGFKFVFVVIGLWIIFKSVGVVWASCKEKRPVNPFSIDYIILKIKKDSDLYRENGSVNLSASRSEIDQPPTPPPPDV